MKILAVVLLSVTMLSSGALAQTKTGPKAAEKPVAVESSPLDTAKATLDAHGGDKLKNMKSLVLRGSVDISGAFPMVIPATFSLVTSGDKYVFELNNPFQPLKQISDGKQTYSSGYVLPPVTSLGFTLLPRVGSTGYVVSALPQDKKKKGFRVTNPEGFYTDFLIDEKTRQIKGYESAYDVDGRIVTTSVEIDEFLTVEGVIVPKKYSQRMDLGQVTFYGSYKTKDILVNSTVDDALFTIPK